jgi:hypothetical protein
MRRIVAGLFVSLDGVVGDGKHLFDDWSGELPLRLVESRALGNGVVALVYGPAFSSG